MTVVRDSDLDRVCIRCNCRFGRHSSSRGVCPDNGGDMPLDYETNPHTFIDSKRRRPKKCDALVNPKQYGTWEL